MGVGMRFGKKYDWLRTEPGRHTGNCYASVTMSNATCAILHLAAKVPVEVPSPSSFLETLQSFGNGSLWDNLSVDGDGEWIGRAVITGSLRIAHQWIVHAGNVNHHLFGWSGHVLQDFQVMVKTIHCGEV